MTFTFTNKKKKRKTKRKQNNNKNREKNHLLSWTLFVKNEFVILAYLIDYHLLPANAHEKVLQAFAYTVASTYIKRNQYKPVHKNDKALPVFTYSTVLPVFTYSISVASVYTRLSAASVLHTV